MNYNKYGVEFDNPQSKQDQWTLGVFFYGQAFSMTIVSLFLYFVPYREHLGYIGSKTTVFSDIELLLRIFNDKEELYGHSWREHAVRVCIFGPACFLAVELIFNKIRIPGRHILVTLFLSLVYLLLTYVINISNFGYIDFPIYP